MGYRDRGRFGSTLLFFLHMAVARPLHSHCGQRSEVLLYLCLFTCSYIGPRCCHYLKVPKARHPLFGMFNLHRYQARISKWTCNQFGAGFGCLDEYWMSRIGSTLLSITHPSRAQHGHLGTVGGTNCNPPLSRRTRTHHRWSHTFVLHPTVWILRSINISDWLQVGLLCPGRGIVAGHEAVG